MIESCNPRSVSQKLSLYVKTVEIRTKNGISLMAMEMPAIHKPNHPFENGMISICARAASSREIDSTSTIWDESHGPRSSRARSSQVLCQIHPRRDRRLNSVSWRKKIAQRDCWRKHFKNDRLIKYRRIYI